MPPPQPCRACAPEPTPVAYVPNAPISNSFGLKNSGGGGGGGAITCFEDNIGSPAKMTTACETSVITAKAINFFIMSSFELNTAHVDCVFRTILSSWRV